MLSPLTQCELNSLLLSEAPEKFCMTSDCKGSSPTSSGGQLTLKAINILPVQGHTTYHHVYLCVSLDVQK